MNTELARVLSRAEEDDRRKLEEMKSALDRQKVIRAFIAGRSDDELAYIASLLPSSARVNGASTQAHKVGRDLRALKVPDYGPVTAKGTLRIRQWGTLRPAIDQAIAKLDRITSIGLYEYLVKHNFPFGAEARNRSVSSIASYLRKLEEDGKLTVPGPRGKGTRNIEFRKVAKA